MTQAQSFNKIVKERNSYDHQSYENHMDLNNSYENHMFNHMSTKHCGNELNPHHKSVKQVDRLVDYLLSKFKNEKYIPVFRKACWQISESQLHLMVESATAPEVKSPIAYFISSIKRHKDYHS